MTALIWRATPFIEMVAQRMMFQSADARTIAGHRRVADRSEPPPARSASSCALDLSKSRTYDAALDILGAYKLTGNFHTNLEIVLKNIGAFDQVTFEPEPNAKLLHHPDCRRVVFRSNPEVRADRFSEIIRSLQARIGSDAALPWRASNAA
jgi:hypothetical protein